MKVLVQLPSTLKERVDLVALHESRTRSDLIREALRRYCDEFARTHLGAGTPVKDAERLEKAFGLDLNT